MALIAIPMSDLVSKLKAALRWMKCQPKGKAGMARDKMHDDMQSPHRKPRKDVSDKP